ncbi:tetratricopeptide repeat protein [Salinicola acroporae]|nr:tetratricopeptide repeat protein [Salinicola acroporae]
MRWFFSFLSLFFFHSAFAGILFQDPTGDELNSAIKNMSLSDIEGMAEDGEGKGEYYLGLIYLNGSKQFGVEKSCDKSSELLRHAWQMGVVDAGYMLSVMSYRGICVEKNFDRVKELAQETADEGYLLSQRMLGRAYLGSEWKGLYKKNLDKAVCWLSKAGESGDSESAAKLSYLYREGVGVKKDEELSFYWLKKASFSKFDPGEIIYFPSLAEYYESGVGTEADLVQAYKYYDLSGSAGVDDKQRIAKEMTQEQIDEALRQSKEWQKEHNVQVGGGFIRRAN